MNSSRTLRLVEGEPEEVGTVATAETLAISRAVRDIDGWLTSLPCASEWYWRFVRARDALVDELAARELPQTALP